MKKFSFRLQTVLEMKEKTLQNKQLEMAKISRLLAEQTRTLDDLNHKKEVTRNSLVKIYDAKTELDVFTITNYKNYLALVINDIKKQQEVIEHTKKILAEKQKEVKIALKDVKVLEKLKEKQRDRFYQHYLHLEGKEIDDIATSRYKRA